MTPCPSGRVTNHSACSRALGRSLVIRGEAGWTTAHAEPNRHPLLETSNLQRDSVHFWSVDTHANPELEGSVVLRPRVLEGLAQHPDNQLLIFLKTG